MVRKAKKALEQDVKMVAQSEDALELKVLLAELISSMDDGTATRMAQFYLPLFDDEDDDDGDED
jgi:hypothetical protein